MSEIKNEHELPGAAVPYVVRSGFGLRHLVGGEVVHTLAGVDETSGGFGVMICDAPWSRAPIPMHYHEREHDTWLCTRGKLRVWCGDQSRVMRPGDFGYVKPYDTHSYQSVGPRMGFFGVVAPGGWEKFMAEAGEVWGMTALPPADRPFDFSRMGAAMAKHDVHRVDNPTYVDAIEMSEADQGLPEGHASYFLEAGHGPRHTLFGHLATTLIAAAQSGSTLDIRTLEAGRGTALPALRHEKTTLFLYLLAGEILVMLDGAEYRVAAGDGVNIPPGTTYSTRVLSGTARWVAASAGGNGGALWDTGAGTDDFLFPMVADGTAEPATLHGASGIDVVLA